MAYKGIDGENREMLRVNREMLQANREMRHRKPGINRKDLFDDSA